MPGGSAWAAVLSLIERFEDGAALMQLFEYRDGELCANGEPISVLLDGSASERAVASFLADHFDQREATSSWSHAAFYRATRGLDLDAHEVEAFVERCRMVGVVFSYR